LISAFMASDAYKNHHRAIEIKQIRTYVAASSYANISCWVVSGTQSYSQTKTIDDCNTWAVGRVDLLR
jgi:hypothetical protein